MITDREDPSGIQIDRTVLSVRDAMDGMTEERVVSSIGIGIGITVGWVGCKFVYSRFIFKWDRNNLNFFKMLQKKPIYPESWKKVSTNESVGKRNESYPV